ncbi:TPA: adenylyl-sulfate kinase [Pseudomonas aeruginosa]|nr:adenylyl-sulfate kinase [Pseudomonas aeruginosa]HBN7888333.1 adenylyl-sulfate kinase [Pseudomonas aeruginosa]HBN8826645.1 adenylyl-sulfate kinase [Pseudomonas aeruginosa]HBN9260196.1 adenylyl-sulfate kinase [Pseudomonas aeruginosa]HEJ4476504.1 adenylyl-sulfate kinase [Pseudomonas aeruginosa]
MNPREHGKRSIDNETRSALKHQRPAVVWLTGLSGAGKSTIANALELALFEQKKHTFLLDGDDLRLGLCRNLGYSDEDRTENIRRIAEVAKILLKAGLIVIVATISPFSRDRRLSRELIGIEHFIEVFVDTPLSECERRDPKGLYRKARSGKIENFTGIDSIYETPAQPNITIDTLSEDPDLAVKRIISYLETNQPA